ncbi:hypothetical protein BDV34DRAFT_223615 [Aspergillus parasiticus]|uniref:Uncharacterized protein n=1 Tax=Aspergillus parasiticus TaxID=5067 RepID=A0A5N6DQI7_ASPPA|nr:hypothetical protein BDV34DRAFT_223615 [Aspergillus parasiticus]
MVYKTYNVENPVLLYKRSDRSLYYLGYEWIQIRWLQYKQSTAEVPLAIGRDYIPSDDSDTTVISFGFDDVRVTTKETGERVSSQDELLFPLAKKMLKVTVEPFDGDVRVYQKVYNFYINISVSIFVSGVPFFFAIKSNELAVGGAKPLTNTGCINVLQ